MMTLLNITDRPVITRDNMHAVTARKWDALLAGILRGDDQAAILTRAGTWHTVRTVADLRAFVRAGGEIW